MARSVLKGVVEGTDADRQQAWRAVQAFDRMRMQLQGFARRVTGNPTVMIHPTDGVTRTDRNTIFIRPPLGLGNNVSHERSKCSKRDEEGRQICHACRLREVIDFYLFHEISHIAFKTLEPLDYTRASPVMAEYLKDWHPVEACSHEAILRHKLAGTTGEGGKLVLSVFNPYLPMLFNCLEDARVNERMFDARPGLRGIFKLNIERLMTEGSENTIGKFDKWIDAPLDSQFMIGTFLLSSGESLEGKLAPAVVEALATDGIVDACARAIQAQDATDIFSLSMEVFRLAQTLGFCVVPKCETAPKPEEQPAGLPADDAGSEGSADDGERSDPGASDESASASDAAESEKGSDSEPGEDGDSSGGGGYPEEGEGNSSSNLEESDGPNSSNGDGGPDSEESKTGDGTPEDDDGPAPSEDSEGSDGGNSDDGENDPSSGGLGDGTSADNAESETSTGPRTGVQSSDNTEFDDGTPDDSNASGGRGDDNQEVDLPELGDPSDESDSYEGSAQDSNSSGEIQSDSSSERRALDPEPEDQQQQNAESHGSDDPGIEAEADNWETDEDPDLDADDTEPHNPWDTTGGDDQEAPIGAPSGDASGQEPVTPHNGTPEDAARSIARFLMHGSDDEPSLLDEMADGKIEDMTGEKEDEELPDYLKRILKIAILQYIFFDTSSANVAGVVTVKFPERRLRWTSLLKPEEFMPTEALLGKAVLKARRVFEDNKRAGYDRNRKSGHINTRVLGRRAPVGDPRLFGKRIIPTKRDYEVIIGMDCSGSTDWFERNEKIKRAVFASATLLDRLGVKFSIYAHTAFEGQLSDFMLNARGRGDFYVYILPVKEPNDPWNQQTKIKLANIKACSDNLDGHTLQQYRKFAERSQATDKIIIYYTDGAMPAANKDEEQDILEEEIKLCDQRGITLLGVGINTDSPKAYGMDTVRIDSDEDIIKVVEQLDRRLIR